MMRKVVIAALLALVALRASADVVDPTGAKGAYQPDITKSGVIDGMGDTVRITLWGRPAAGVTIDTTDFEGEVAGEYSVDGGVTWTNAGFLDVTNTTPAGSASLVFGGSTDTKTAQLIAIGGASDVRIHVTSYVGGTATVKMRATGQAAVMIYGKVVVPDVNRVDSIGSIDGPIAPGTGNVSLGKAEGDPQNAGDTGVAALAVRRDTPSAGTGVADGDYGSPSMDANGLLRVNASGVAVPVTDNGGSLTVDGTVAVSSITTSVVPGTAATNLGKAEDAAHSSGDVGVQMLTKRTDSAASSAGTDGDYATANTDANGLLWVNGSGVTQPVSGTVAVSGLSGTSDVNVKQMNGTTTDTNSGNKSAGTVRVVIATDQPALTNKLLVTPDLPSGASTAAKQPALGTAGTASTDVITVQGIAAMTPLLVTPAANSAVNVAQVAGTATDVNSGTKSAGTIRVVLATDQPQLTNKLLVTPDANSAVNVAQLAGTATDTNSGSKSAGTLRVVLATDQPQLTNALKVDASATTQPVSGTVTANQGTGAAVTAPWPVYQGQPTKTTGSITTNADTIPVATPGYSVATVTIHGTYAGITGVFEISDDGGTTYYTTTCTRSDSNTQETGFTTLTNTSRAWDCSIYAATNFRVRSTAYTSGTGTINITMSAAAIEAAPTVALATGANVVGALTANQSVNVAQVAGTTTDTNSGTKSAGTQRVVLATDQPALTTAMPVAPTTSTTASQDGVCTSVAANTTVLASSAARLGAVIHAQCDTVACNTDVVFIKYAATATTGDFPLGPGETLNLTGVGIYTGIIDAIANSGTQKICVVAW